MAFNEGGMASGLLIIAISILFAAGFGFLVLHLYPVHLFKGNKIGNSTTNYKLYVYGLNILFWINTIIVFSPKFVSIK